MGGKHMSFESLCGGIQRSDYGLVKEAIEIFLATKNCKTSKDKAISFRKMQPMGRSIGFHPVVLPK